MEKERRGGGGGQRTDKQYHVQTSFDTFFYLTNEVMAIMTKKLGLSLIQDLRVSMDSMKKNGKKKGPIKLIENLCP